MNKRIQDMAPTIYLNVTVWPMHHIFPILCVDGRVHKLSTYCLISDKRQGIDLPGSYSDYREGIDVTRMIF